MISGPDNGVVFLYWSYILPEFRNSKLAIVGNTFFKNYFDNGNWHKLSTFTRTDNRTALIILKRFGWTEAAHLEKHIFGEDYKIFEVALEKKRLLAIARLLFQVALAELRTGLRACCLRL